MDTLRDIFRQADLRLTKSRCEVFMALESIDVPLTIAEIAKRCPNTNRTSIYRILETFHELHVINTIHIGWKVRYELAEPFIKHHHHLYCTRCHNAEPLETPELERLIALIGRRHHFRVERHHFELEGVCQACMAAGDTQPDPTKTKTTSQA